MPLYSPFSQKDTQFLFAHDYHEFYDIFWNAPIGIFKSTPEGRLLSANPALAHMLGLTTPEELISVITDIPRQLYAHPEDRMEFQRRLEQEGILRNFEFKLLRWDGSTLWVSVNAQAVRDNEGNITQYQGFTADISEHKLAEDRLQQKIDELEKTRNSLAAADLRRQVLMNSSRDGIVIIDQHHKVLEANQSFAGMLGYSLNEVHALHTWDWEAIMPGNDIRESFGDLSRIDMTFETCHQCKDGSIIDVEVSTTGAQIHDQNVVIAICRDISQRKLMERHLEHSYSLMRYIIEHANSAVAVHDKYYRYMYVSQSYLKQFQIEETSIIGKHHYAVFPDLPQKWRDSHKRALCGEISRGEQDPFYRRDGRLEWTRWECRPWYEADNSIGGFIVYTEIITDRINDEQAQAEQKALLEAIFSNAPLLLIMVNAQRRIQQINEFAARFAGREKQEMLGLRGGEALRCLHALDAAEGCGSGAPCRQCAIRKTVTNTLDHGTTHLQVEAPFSFATGNEIHHLTLLISSTPVMFQDSRMALVTLQDITERKKFEEQLKYLSMHDQLTGLYNRAYLENKIERLGECNEYPLTIICMDLDGLKLVNDTLGHDYGDRQLELCAQILKHSFRASDTVARVGGDEFTALLPRTDLEAAEVIVKRIRARLESYNQEYKQKIPLGLSIGLACAQAQRQDLSQTYKQADDLMYRDKLNRGINSRSQIIKALIAALDERDFITSGHVLRLEDLCVDIGQAVNLSSAQLSNLTLLAQMHDLGKVGIPDHILFKAGPLTDEEWDIMRQHPEKGYRIAQATTDLAGIAGLVLRHHEQWDGQGYPLGLARENIPIECRILAIADSFDAMTNDRPYRKALSVDEALAELQKHAGTQFDPQLVEVFLQIMKDKRSQ